MLKWLQLIRFGGRLTVLESRLDELVGEEVARALRAENLLDDAGAAVRYPCNARDEGCPRHVHRRADGSCLAYCGNVPNGCVDLELKESELHRVSLSLERFLALLQRLLGLEGQVRSEPALENTFSLGRTNSREVLVSFAAHSAGFANALAAWQAARRRLCVLVPVRERIEPLLCRAHGSGANVELDFLEDLLLLAGDRIQIRGRPSALADEDVIGHREDRGRVEQPYCFALERGEERPISRAEYERLVAAASDYDLFVDLISGDGRTCRAGRRKQAGGTFEEIRLSASEGALLARLIQSGRPQRAAQLNPGSGDRTKMLARLRAKLDVREGRSWRTIREVPGGAKESREFVFRPPEGVRYLLLRLA
jgi:hypothetical protein